MVNVLKIVYKMLIMRKQDVELVDRFIYEMNIVLL